MLQQLTTSTHMARPLCKLGFAAALAVAAPVAAAPAFPGATGYGQNVSGGRGGAVCQVTNLNDSGSGSLRSCIAATGPRTIVFRTSGTITLNSPLAILNGNLTIAGQTAPAPGIQLRMAPTSTGQPMYAKGANSANVLIRHLKFRPGTPGTNPSFVDCFTIENTQNIYLDHVSCSFAYDEGLSGHKDVRLVTISDSINGPNIYPHSKGSLWCSDARNWCGQLTERSNLYFTNRDRNPELNGKGGAAYKFDYINNFYYNPSSQFAELWCTQSGGTTNGTHANFVNNIMWRGPNTISKPYAFYFNPNWNGVSCAPKLHQSGNELSAGILPYPAAQAQYVSSSMIGTLSAPARSVAEAKTHMKARVGAFWWARDPLDAKIVADTFNNAGPLGVLQYPGQYGYSIPAFAVRTSPADYDRDGMSDQWERENGFNPAIADNNGDADRDGFTNLEEYLAARAEGDQR